MKTVSELIPELARIGEGLSKEDNDILIDASLHLSSLQQSLRQEVSRLERLEPLAREVCAAVEKYTEKVN